MSLSLGQVERKTPTRRELSHYKEPEEVARDNAQSLEHRRKTFIHWLELIESTREDLSTFAVEAELYEVPKVISNCMVSLGEAFSKLEFRAKALGINVNKK